MSFEWPRTTFDQLCDIKRGASPRPIHDWLAPTGIPWVKISDATASTSPFISKTAEFIRPEGAKKSVEVFPGDFILSNSATPGIPKFMQIHACVHDGWMLLRNFRGLDQWYCYYLLQTERENLIRQGNGSVFTNLKTEILKKHEVIVPPLDYQKQVAAFLRTLDDRIALLRETNATLEAIAQALFKSWFVDFDPVRAKMEGRTPEGMDEATAALFPDGLETSELGAVPRGWVLKPFGALLAHSIGGDWGSEQPEEKNTVRVAIIRGTDIPDLQNGRDNRVPIRYTSEKKLSTRQLQDGDIVIEVSGGSKDQPTGRALYVTDDLLKRFDCPVEPASFCRLFRPVDRATGVLLGQHLRFIYNQGKTWEYQNQSTGIANFQTTHFLEKELVAVPPDSVLNVFSEIVRALVDRTLTIQIDELTQIRDTLLPRLISGQLRLPEAQATTEAALGGVPQA
ncbi:restriction endonuclease subunit S [Comamonas aquatica]|uniref:restriction endonuclease subunit S n=1 Tax=Comamonas aquatica TaxID=225991 RepID=UPI001B35C828|nr:restriction endonuclease subunit S [Comamonas aquatica]QTX20584.1 restriction endonuclease subunit S [Comamonas aquatica]